MKAGRIEEAKQYYDLMMSGKKRAEIAEMYGKTDGYVAGLIYQYEKYIEADGEEVIGEASTFEQGDDFINVVCASKRIMSKDDIVKKFKIDLAIWEIESISVGTHEGYRKDRSVKWQVQDGTVLHGEVNDTGKMLVVPLYKINVRFAKKKVSLTRDTITEILNNISPESPHIERKADNGGRAFILPIADLHYGLVATQDICGNDYNLALAEKLFFDVINDAVDKIKISTISEIVFIIGNDFLNSDNLAGGTTKGTPQDNGAFWFDLVQGATNMIVKAVSILSEYAPVKIVNVSANHDEHSLFAITKIVETYFRNNENITVDSSPFPRKYYHFGKSVVGFTHDIPVKNCLEVMTVEAKQYWAECDHFYWMLAHLHKSMEYEQVGMLEIWRLPTISGNSRWAANSGFTQPFKRSRGFVLDRVNGITDIYNFYV